MGSKNSICCLGKPQIRKDKSNHISSDSEISTDSSKNKTHHEKNKEKQKKSSLKKSARILKKADALELKAKSHDESKKKSKRSKVSGKGKFGLKKKTTVTGWDLFDKVAGIDKISSISMIKINELRETGLSDDENTNHCGSKPRHKSSRTFNKSQHSFNRSKRNRPNLPYEGEEEYSIDKAFSNFSSTRLKKRKPVAGPLRLSKFYTRSLVK
ncbi:unnamed protein product [Moneuplotes crassus]|uniref:Uncharacterized protein n=1 Tax=Euplotes crassus TaxID=5936 RepID=A0AAD1X6T4_EUPCR|nr:unnamed protein product [Moneuplotes crassus]